MNRHADIEGLPSDGSGFIAVASPSPLLNHLLEDSKLFGQLDLIVAHDLHALEPNYELLLSRLKWTHANVRIVGSSASLLDSSDLGSWLSILPRFNYSFSPAVRSLSVINTFQAFTTPHSLALLRSMIKPAYDAMRLNSGSTIVFVPSRGQCKFTVNDLVKQTAIDLETSFLISDSEEMDFLTRNLADLELKEGLAHGIGIYHEGLKMEEQILMLDLFQSGKIKILICSRETCWNLPIRATLVIVLSCQFAILKEENQREIKNYDLVDLLQMQSLALPLDSNGSAELVVFCQAEQIDFYEKFLLSGLNLESELSFAEKLLESIYHDLGTGSIKSRQDMIEWFSWTYFARRIETNPNYYSSEGGNVNDQLSLLVNATLLKLERMSLVLLEGKVELQFSLIGKLFLHRGVGVGDIIKLQSASIDKLLEIIKTAEVENQKELTEIAVAALMQFYGRLPRTLKDTIGVGPTDEAEEEEKREFRRRVLLVAFTQGRIPRDTGLAKEQALLLKRLLNLTGV